MRYCVNHQDQYGDYVWLEIDFYVIDGKVLCKDCQDQAERMGFTVVNPYTRRLYNNG